MCGRFDLHTPMPVIAERWFGITDAVDESPPRYNIPPGTNIAMLRNREGDVGFDFAHWGYRPRWAGGDAPRPINAKSETVATSRYFRRAFQHQRCLIPANGWFEWTQGPTGKLPHYITQQGAGTDDILFFAGIWEGSIEAGFCTAILTEPAAPNLNHIHSRQPVVLDPECRYDWLNSGLTERDKIKKTCTSPGSREADQLACYACNEQTGPRRPSHH